MVGQKPSKSVKHNKSAIQNLFNGGPNLCAPPPSNQASQDCSKHTENDDGDNAWGDFVGS